MNIVKNYFTRQFYAIVFLGIMTLVISACRSGRNTVFAEEGPRLEKTLLWRISGKEMTAPSYLFGTIHMVCDGKSLMTDTLKTVIQRSHAIYFEVDMDNLVEMMGAMTQMSMKGDTTLADLLTGEEYARVKAYFKEQGGLLPFSMVEKYKPFLAASTMLGNSMPCKQTVAMEQLIMDEAKKQKKKINGLETLAYQMSIFDSIPYKTQAKMLLQYIESADANGDVDSQREYQGLLDAYREQDLGQLEKLTRQNDMGIANFEEILLFNRNRNWVKKMGTILKDKSFLFAVGAGHLPGKLGLINLLRESGYTVEPVSNPIVLPKPVTREI